MDALASHQPRSTGITPSNGASRARLAAIVVAVVILALVGYFIVASLSGTRDSRLVPGAPQSSMAERLQVMSPVDRQSLIARERNALSNNPLDQAALKNLALLWRAENDQERASRLTVLAGDRSLRDLRAQTEVLDILIQRKDFGAALYRLDALLRAQPERQLDLIKVAALFAQSEESRPALVATLAKDPPWRGALISSVAGGSNGTAVVYGLFSELRKSGAEPTRGELRELISKLIANRDFDTAYFVWLDFLSATELRKAENIYDGGFELDAQNLLFGWNFDKLRNTDIRLIPRSTSSTDRMLRVEFMNTRERFAHVSQILRLAPGFYNLTGETKAERLATEVGLVWRLYCLGEKEHPIAATGRLFAASTWAPFEAAFEVPAQDCGAQRLRLEVDSQAKLDQLISGQVYFDNLQIRQRR